MSPGRIVTGDQINGDLTLKPDVCIVGSGPGGAIMAQRLARQGASVIVLEEGGYHLKDEFDMQEATAFPRLYQDRGNRATADLSIAVLQGRAVGGGTVVNWTTSYRTPAPVLGRARPGEHVADSEADQHLEPQGEMVRVDESPRQPRPGRGLPPSEEPCPAGEVVEEREKRHHPAEEQQHPQQAAEPEARPHEIDDEDVHRGVGEEEAEGARGLRR